MTVPRTTATTGLTYAYVAMNGSGATRSSQPKTVKASRLPMTTRYRNAAIDGPETVAGENWTHSPETVAIVMSTIAPATIWVPVATRGWRGRRARCDA